MHEEAIFEIKERLLEVNRTFTKPAIITGHPTPWADAFPEAKVVKDSAGLALEPCDHDLVIHAMPLHWANDPVGQIIQCRRALTPAGLFLGVSLGGRTLSELRAALGQAEIELRGGLSPRIAPMGEIRDLGALLQRSGLALPVADSLLRTASYETAKALMHDLRAMGETNAIAARDRRAPTRKLFARMGELYEQTYRDETGRITASFELIFLTGWAPDASQPEPLRPGAAKARLADALGVREFNARTKPDS
ncbi:MAG TPA: SAM-dependent methyltransferase [Aliiroseovarius sp.]|nr:SAM-dependent methyltransferase [Aliiroseovarius sp.]